MKDENGKIIYLQKLICIVENNSIKIYTLQNFYFVTFMLKAEKEMRTLKNLQII